MLSDRLLDSQEKVVKLRKALKKKKLPCSEELADHKIVQEHYEQVRDQPAEKSEDDEEIEKVPIVRWRCYVKPMRETRLPVRV